jgi:hypothetical protein
VAAFDFSKVAGGSDNSDTVRVSEKVVEQCNKQGVNQACISLTGSLVKRAGKVRFKIGKKEYELTKVKGQFNIYLSHQKDQAAKTSFGDLFNHLAEEAGATQPIEVLE